MIIFSAHGGHVAPQRLRLCRVLGQAAGYQTKALAAFLLARLNAELLAGSVRYLDIICGTCMFYGIRNVIGFTLAQPMTSDDASRNTDAAKRIQHCG